MDFTWLNAANDLVTAVVTIFGTVAGYIAAHKRGWVYSSVKTIAKEGSRLVKDAEQVAEGVGQLVPAVGAAEQALTAEVEQLAAKARQTELYRVAAVGLHAFGATLDALSEDQRKALSFFVASKVPGVTPQEVADALEFVQKESNEAANSPLFTAANAFTQAQQSASA
jgi:hypothetical protein